MALPGYRYTGRRTLSRAVDSIDQGGRPQSILTNTRSCPPSELGQTDSQVPQLITHHTLHHYPHNTSFTGLESQFSAPAIVLAPTGASARSSSQGFPRLHLSNTGYVARLKRLIWSLWTQRSGLKLRLSNWYSHLTCGSDTHRVDLRKIRCRECNMLLTP